VPDAPNFRIGLRLRVALAVLRMAPGQYRQRRRRVVARSPVRTTQWSVPPRNDPET
jgi:hypothetical protein